MTNKRGPRCDASPLTDAFVFEADVDNDVSTNRLRVLNQHNEANPEKLGERIDEKNRSEIRNANAQDLERISPSSSASSRSRKAALIRKMLTWSVPQSP
jgi:hypothetical protein